MLDQATRKFGAPPKFISGEVSTQPVISDPDVQVILDDQDLEIWSDDSVTIDEENHEEEAVTATLVCGAPALGDRVLCMWVPDGSLYVIGNMAGNHRILGGAVVTANQTDATGNDVLLTDLETDVEITGERRWIEVTGHGLLAATSDGQEGVGRLWRIEMDDDEDAETATEIGRWGMDDLRGGGLGEIWQASAYDFVEPGTYVYYMTCQVNGGFTLRAATSPAWIRVEDCGPVPEDITWPA